MKNIWAVDQATGTFLYGGTEPYDCDPGLSQGQIRVVLDREPDPRIEIYSGDIKNPFVRKTDEQIATYDSTSVNKETHDIVTDNEGVLAILRRIVVELEDIRSIISPHTPNVNGVAQGIVNGAAADLSAKKQPSK